MKKTLRYGLLFSGMLVFVMHAKYDTTPHERMLERKHHYIEKLTQDLDNVQKHALKHLRTEIQTRDAHKELHQEEYNRAQAADDKAALDNAWNERVLLNAKHTRKIKTEQWFVTMTAKNNARRQAIQSNLRGDEAQLNFAITTLKKDIEKQKRFQSDWQSSAQDAKRAYESDKKKLKQ